MTNGRPSVSAHESTSERSALIHALRVVRERWWLVAVCFVVCVAISVAIAVSSVKQYTATATLLIRPSALPALIDPTQAQAQDSTTLARQQSDDAALIASSPVAALVKRTLHSPKSVSDLQGEVVASAQTSNDLTNVSITDPNPVRAARVANAFANSLVSYLTQSAQAQLISGQTRLQSELAQLPPADPGRPALTQGLKQVIALKAVTNGGAQVVDAAAVPGSPSSPGVKRDAALGGVAGIAIGLALAFMLDVFDRRVKSGDELERLYGLSALTWVPLRRRRPTSERAIQADLEPFRILRDGLPYISLRQETRVILVTSAVPGEGKTRVATGLATAIAAPHKAVALVEADVHRPAIGSQFGLKSDGRGLMNALVEGTSPLDLVQVVPHLPSLSVLSSGAFTPNSAELLRSPAMTNVLAELVREFEFVILDGPPLLPVADAQVLLDGPMIDVVLIVARPNVTTREQVHGALAVLKRHHKKGIGLAVNGVRESASGYYYTGATANGSPPTLRRGLGRLVGSVRRRD